jgi:hypothetical protein
MPITEGNDTLPMDSAGTKQMGFKRPSGNLYVPTMYAEGDTDASIDGFALLWEDASDTLRPVSATKPLPVDPGQSVMAAAADATGTDKHRWLAASAAAALTGAAVKASSGVIYGYHIANLHTTTAIWVHYYDAASVTGTPEVSLYVPGGAVLDHPSIGAPVGGWGTGIFVSASATADGTGEPAAVPYVLTLWK